MRKVVSYSDQYSSHTIDIAIRYQNEPFGGSNYDYQLGYTQEPTGNDIPQVIVPESGFYIPKETPFILEGYATGNNDHNFTYAWEQNDASDYGWSPPEYPADTGPLFCSVDATPHGNTRYFPQLESVVNGNYSTGNIEMLPFAFREINMRLQVRDNDLYSGAYNYANVQFYADGNAGPFRVTSQSETEIWPTNSLQEITWDVANTDNPFTVNSTMVHILLSIDGGENFDIVLDEYVNNDGYHQITVPHLPSLTDARIMVKSADNYFFDVNSASINIVNNQQAQISVNSDELVINSAVDVEQEIQREIENSGDEGSILVYDARTQIHYEGEGYLSFDGNDDYVDLGSNLLHGNGDFSLSLWVKSNSTNAVIIQQRNGGFNGEYQLKFNGSGQLDFFTYKDGYRWSVVTPMTYNDNQWHHVVVVQSNEIDGGKIYVDGEEKASNNGGVVFLEGYIHSYLGADMRDYNKYLFGDLNDVMIFESAISTDEVQSIFNYGFAFNPTYNHHGFESSESLVSYFPMTNMTGTTLTDEMGEHHGEINGAVWGGDLIPIPNWLSVSPTTSWVNAGESEYLHINTNTVGLRANTVYTGDVIILSNTQNSPLIIPIQLNVLENSMLGDLNFDNAVNILDVVIMVNLILSGEYNNVGDMNVDGSLNILDIVMAVNLIIGIN